MRNRNVLPAALPLACWLACACSGALAQAAPAAEVVVTGSPRAQKTLDAPFAITTVDASALRDAGPMVNLSEALVQVPGLVVNNRNNYAQDLQISARGFGALVLSVRLEAPGYRELGWSVVEDAVRGGRGTPPLARCSP